VEGKGEKEKKKKKKKGGGESIILVPVAFVALLMCKATWSLH
jgi:hypothetical protein